MQFRTGWTVRSVLLVASFSAACNPVTSPSPASTLPEFEGQLEQIRNERQIPGMSAAIVSGERIAWSHGFGFANVEQHIAATDTTAFHLASLTKTFASTIAMQLVQAGTLSLDAPVSDFGITLASPGVVRVRHLLNHTSEGDPGSTYAYNGDRFGLMDQVIFRASGETFGRLVTRVILAPLHLGHTAPNLLNPVAFKLASLDRTAFERNLAQGYSSDGRTPIAYPAGFGTAAGLIGSALDVAHYSIAIDRNTFLSAATQAQAFTPAVSTRGDTLPYGIGWFVQRVNGVKVQWHYGYWTGNSSLIIRVPERGLAFVLLANSDGLSRATTLGSGNLMSSPAAKAFLDAFVFGKVKVPDHD